jgi:ribose/xylose/arabinose/galactoside ABC-type transport system permease subunit
MLAIVRPSSWNPLLFIHVAGAMALVATLVVALFALRVATTRGDQPTTRFAFRSLWMGVLPSYIVMRVGAQLIVDKEQLSNSKASWIGIGFTVSDAGAVLLLVTILLAGLAYRTTNQGTPVPAAGRLRAATILSGILLVAYVVAIYAMTAKPS